MDALLGLGWIEVQGDEFHSPVRLTPDGADAMSRLGIDADALTAKKRKFAFSCLDWTERRYHLGGALGVEVMRSLETGGYVKQLPASRKIEQLKPIGEWLRGGSPVL